MRALLLALLLVPSAAGTAATAQENENAYLIGARDHVWIRVAELAEIDLEIEVAEDGSVELPVIGRLEAHGYTEKQLADAIRQRLEETGLRRATVSVRVTVFRSRPVSVLGSVDRPGNQFVARQATLLEVLLEAGGLNDKSGQWIQVRRRATNGLSDQITISAQDLFELGDPAVNIPIFAGDIIVVPAAQTIRVSFLGAIGRPGMLSLRGEQTLLMAIAQMGGLSDSASKKIRIRRRGPGGEQIELVVNYKRILGGRDPDIELHDGDVIIVKEAFF